MSVIRSLVRSALPLSLCALLGAASCTSILGDDFEIDSDGSGDGDGDSSGSSSGGVGVCEQADEACGLCLCDTCEDLANECLGDSTCVTCVLEGDEVACNSDDVELNFEAVSCFYGSCSLECGGGGGG